MLKTIRTQCFFLKEYSNFSNFRIFTELHLNYDLLESFKNFLKEGTKLDVQRGYKYGTHFFTIPFGADLTLEKLEVLIRDFEKTFPLDNYFQDQSQERIIKKNIRDNWFLVWSINRKVLWIYVDKSLEYQFSIGTQILKNLKELLGRVLVSVIPKTKFFIEPFFQQNPPSLILSIPYHSFESIDYFQYYQILLGKIPITSQAIYEEHECFISSEI